MSFDKIKTLGDKVADIGFKYFTNEAERLVWSHSVIQLFEHAVRGPRNDLLKTFSSFTHDSIRARLFHKRRGLLLASYRARTFDIPLGWWDVVGEYIVELEAYARANKNNWFWTAGDAKRNNEYLVLLLAVRSEILEIKG